MFGISKLQFYVISGIIIVSILGTSLLMWRHSIRQQALQEFNNKQLEQVIKDQAEFKATTNKLNALAKQILEQQDKNNKELQIKIEDVNSYLNSLNATKIDRPASELLRETLKRLGAPEK